MRQTSPTRRPSRPTPTCSCLAVSFLAAVALVLTAAPSRATHSYHAELVGSGLKSVTRKMWGWTDGTHEYVLVCVRTRLDVFDVSVPSAPQRVAAVPALGQDLRSVRTRGQYAYAVNQNGPIQIIDLSNPASIQTVATYQSATVPGAHTVFIEGDYLYASLWGVGAGELRILDISDPLAPVEVGFWSHPDATPPAAPSVLEDASAPGWLPPPKLCGCLGAGGMLDPEFEGDDAPSLEPVAPGAYQAYGPSGVVSPVHPEVAFATAGYPVMVHESFVRGDTAFVSCGGGGFAVVDLTDRTNPQTISVVTYENPAAHTTWLSEDSQYLFLTDERPEAPLTVWDVRDLQQIVKVAEFETGDGGIPHTIQVQDDLAFVAYYTEGLRVLDISDPTDPIEVAYYDQHTGPPGAYFEGTIAAYPYSPSGLVFINDMKRGLFVLDVDRETRGGTLWGYASGDGEAVGIEGARVRFLEIGKSVVTDATGQYHMGLPEGAHTVVVEAYGYYPDTVQVTIEEDVATGHHPTLLQRPTGRLQLAVHAAWNGQPLEGVAVAIPELPVSVRYTDAEGIVDWGTVPAGLYYPTLGRWSCRTQLDTVQVLSELPSDPFGPILFMQYGFNDSAHVDQGWILEGEGTDATAGRWVRADPSPSWSILPGAVSPDWDANVTPFGYAYHTGYQVPDQPQNVYDVDGGVAVLMSPRFDLTVMPHASLEYHRWFSNDTGANPGEDSFRAEISFDDGLSWSTLEETFTSERAWKAKAFPLWEVDDPTDRMRLRFTAEDLGGDSIVEAALDRLIMYFDVVDVPVGTSPGRLLLAPPAPNPSPRGRALVRFQLPREANSCRLDVIDVRGRLVRELVDGPLPAGYHAIRLESLGGAELAPGTYWLRLQADGEQRSQKIVIVGG